MPGNVLVYCMPGLVSVTSAGQVQQLSLPQPVLDLYLRDHSVLIVDEYELSSRHPLQHRIGLVQWNLLNSFQLLKHNR